MGDCVLTEHPNYNRSSLPWAVSDIGKKFAAKKGISSLPSFSVDHINGKPPVQVTGRGHHHGCCLREEVIPGLQQLHHHHHHNHHQQQQQRLQKEGWLLIVLLLYSGNPSF
jgi:hypothetical protein